MTDAPHAASARAVGEAALERGITVAAAESVTAGGIATALAAAPDASDWFGGSVVAYRTPVKQRALGITTDQVITERCAREMAIGVLNVTGATVAVAVTGVGGPDPEEDQPAGTVFICAGTRDGLQVFAHRFGGQPAEVVEQATEQALVHLGDAVRQRLTAGTT